MVSSSLSCVVYVCSLWYNNVKFVKEADGGKKKGNSKSRG